MVLGCCIFYCNMPHSKVCGRWCTTTVRFLLTLPTSLRYKGRPLVAFIGRSIVAAALVAGLGYLMMLIVFILHLPILLCTTVKVKNYYALLNTQYPSNTLFFCIQRYPVIAVLLILLGIMFIELNRVSYSAIYGLNRLSGESSPSLHRSWWDHGEKLHQQ